MKSQNIFLANPNNSSADIVGLFSNLLNTKFSEKVTSIEKMTGGINSEAFKITSDKNNEYFGKIYNTKKGDNRERLVKEFFGLTFLWENGIRNIPRPLLADEKAGIAIYRFIRNSQIRPGDITAADIDEAADFAGRIHSLTRSKGADTQPVATEACFSIKAYIDCVDGRVDKLKKTIKEHAIFDSLRAYLEDKFIPFFEATKKAAKQKAESLGIDVNEKLNRCNQTLSVSDFGFHNAIKSEDGRLFFFDLEYYGWDDPAKMIADFYLQPAVPVPPIYRERFFGKVRKNYSENTKLEKRLSIIYPILGLKWCLIMLNVFLHINNHENDKAVCLRHLVRAINKLQEIKREINKEAFPISLA
jgi:thiamine kinase-like enzyme